MERGFQSIKTKPLPSEDSEEESTEEESGSEEEDVKEESEYESESDESTDASKQKAQVIINGKQQQPAVAKAAAAPASPAKRSRESNGKKEKEEEPSSKKKKSEVVTPVQKAASSKPAVQSATKGEKSQQQGKAKENPSKAEKSKSPLLAKADKDKPQKQSVEKESKKSQKKKSLNPVDVSKGDTPKPATSSKSEGEKDNDKGTPQKQPKKPAQQWTGDEEFALSKQLQKDHAKGVYGAGHPISRADPYWEKVLKQLPFLEKYEKDQQIERMCEKVRRMRLRYEILLTRIKAGDKSIWKNDKEEPLWKVWDSIWGPIKKDLKEGEEEDEEEETSDEEEDVNMKDAAAPRSKLGVAPGSGDESAKAKLDSIQTKEAEVAGVPPSAAARKEPESKKPESNSEEESDEEENPIKQVSLSVIEKPMLTKESALVKRSDPMVRLQLNSEAEIIGATLTHDHAAQVGEPGTLAVAGERQREGGGSAVSTLEFHSEGLALLQGVRSTCLKMVDEARIQSLLITERLLDEARTKTIQMVDEAREKSSQIMEELRTVAEKLTTVAGASGRLGSSSLGSGSLSFGSWNDFTDGHFPGIINLLAVIDSSSLDSGVSSMEDWTNNMDCPLQGRSFFNGVVDTTQLQDQWREQTEAEQGLILQRLQLVQEQARIQQEGLRLKINLHKQQAEAKGIA